MTTRAPSRCGIFPWTALVLAILLAPSCTGSGSGQPLLTAEMPLHLEEHLDAATIIGSEVRADLLELVDWRFDEPQPGWKATTPRPFPPEIQPLSVSQTDDALQITLGPANAEPDGEWLQGGVHVDVPEWNHRDWTHVLIRARSSGPGRVSLGFNVWDEREVPYLQAWEETGLVRGGRFHTW